MEAPVSPRRPCPAQPWTFSFTRSLCPPPHLRVWPVEGTLVFPDPVSVVTAPGKGFVWHSLGNRQVGRQTKPEREPLSPWVAWSVKGARKGHGNSACTQSPFGQFQEFLTWVRHDWSIVLKTQTWSSWGRRICVSNTQVIQMSPTLRSQQPIRQGCGLRR